MAHVNPVTLRPGIGDNRPTATLYYGQDVRETLRTLPDASVHMACTSPPYWGLRDYGTATWEGGDAECDHLVRTVSAINASIESSTLGGGKKTTGHSKEGFRTVCQRCGARRVDNQIGLEDTPEAFVDALVAVFREVKRVLRPDGTLWVNLGDSYWGGKGASSFGMVQEAGDRGVISKPHQNAVGGRGKTRPQDGSHDSIKPKDLVGIPWRVAFALQADGWYLRSDIIWHKPSCMPESVSDRPTRSHEYVFLFAHPDSGGRYFYDAEAVKEPVSVVQPPRRLGRKEYEAAQADHGHRGAREVAISTGQGTDTSAGNHYGRVFGGHETRNKRSVWTVNPKPYRGAHFAVWPPELVRTMILAGTSAHGVCSTCGAPWARTIDREWCDATRRGYKRAGVADKHWDKLQPTGRIGGFVGGRVETVGWEPTCTCDGVRTIPATVLDPFSGSATTGMVALQEGRNYIGTDLNAEYLPLAESRVREEPPPAVGAAPSIEGDVLDLFGGAE
jgi:DNA modification methylase